MSNYKHRMTLVVPQSLIPQANQLALIVGVSEHDDKTFTSANWQDKDGNLYAVCSTAIKPVVLGMFGVSLSNITLPPHAVNADVRAAQEALDICVMWTGTEKVNTDTILIAINYEPLQFFEDCGLTLSNIYGEINGDN